MSSKPKNVVLISGAMISAFLVITVGCSKAPNANSTGSANVTLNYTPAVGDEATASPTPDNSKNLSSSHAIGLPTPVVPASQVMPNYTPGISLTPSATNVMVPTPN